MKKLIAILMVSAVITACSNKEVSISTIPTTAMASEIGVDIAVKETSFVNPANIEGSNFGNFFLAMLKTQNYDMAIKFTSKESIDRLGADKVLDKYKNFKFNYHLVQKSIVGEKNKFTVVYTTQEYATAKLKKIYLTLENDTCKLVLPDNIDDFLK